MYWDDRAAGDQTARKQGRASWVYGVSVARPSTCWDVRWSRFEALGGRAPVSEGRQGRGLSDVSELTSMTWSDLLY